MTKSTITDERITSVIERLEHYACNLKWTNVRGAQDLLTAADGLRELQERRKADSEPVAYGLIFRNMDGVLNNYINTNTVFATREKAEGYGKGGNYEERSDGGLEWVPNAALDPVVIPLYRHAQPASVVPVVPVVPDVMEPTIEAIKRILPTSNPDEYAACIGADMWNACRAAMLSGGKS
ncbi:hypothetical protein LVW07_24535 [Klebsiella pneumoniae]|nr:hypothetical protein [Klebsiella pneumoniae]